MAGKGTGMLELGLRVRGRREEARLDVPTLAKRSGVTVSELEAFEEGRGGLGIGALMRVATALGVPATSFVHSRAPVVHAPVAPSVVLKGFGPGWLRDSDRDALVAGLRRASAFNEAGELLNAPRLADRFQPTAAPERNAHLSGYDAAIQARGLLLRAGPLRGFCSKINSTCSCFAYLARQGA